MRQPRGRWNNCSRHYDRVEMSTVEVDGASQSQNLNLRQNFQEDHPRSKEKIIHVKMNRILRCHGTSQFSLCFILLLLLLLLFFFFGNISQLIHHSFPLLKYREDQKHGKHKGTKKTYRKTRKTHTHTNLLLLVASLV